MMVEAMSKAVIGFLSLALSFAVTPVLFAGPPPPICPTPFTPGNLTILYVGATSVCGFGKSRSCLRGRRSDHIQGSGNSKRFTELQFHPSLAIS